MPLLPKETDLFPDDLFVLPADRFPWSVAHVRSRQEKALARYLAERAVPFYLPQFESTRRRAGRMFKSYLPLFPGYLFFRGDRTERAVLLRSNLAANLIEVTDQEQLAGELGQIRALQLRGASLQPYQALLPGDPVRIDDGAFAGYSGVVLREKGSDRLVVQVALINRAVLVEFERTVLKKKR